MWRLPRKSSLLALSAQRAVAFASPKRKRGAGRIRRLDAVAPWKVRAKRERVRV